MKKYAGRVRARHNRAGEALPKGIQRRDRATNVGFASAQGLRDCADESSETTAKAKERLQPEAPDEKKFRNRNCREKKTNRARPVIAQPKTGRAQAACRKEWSPQNKPTV